MKLCSKCNVLKPFHEFRKRKEGKLKLHSQCRNCENLGQNTENRKIYLSNYYLNKDNHMKRLQNARRSHLKIKYGISPEQYDEMWIEQLGLCLLCSSKESGIKTYNSLLVDHNHDTNQIRGLICYHCNIAIGFMDRPNFDSNRAVSYIQGKI